MARKILVELGHPKHVHLFRPLLRRWRERGDAVQVVTRDKDITERLLTRYGIPFVSLSKQKRGYRAGMELATRWVRFGRVVREFRPDVVLSVAGITTAPPARTLGVPNLALTDTETAVTSNRIAFPFADCVLTPEWFVGEFGKKHLRYRGFHEWAYLHPDEFHAEAELVTAEGIDPHEPYAVVRLVRWDAAHDRGESGFSRENVIRLAEGLSKKMRVLVSAEGTLPSELEPYAAKFHVDRVHHVLAFSRLVVGESPSMATEAALLGVPAILASSWAGRCGNMQVLEKKYGLMRVFEDSAAATDAALEIAEGATREGRERDTRRAELTAQLECVPDVIERQIQRLINARQN